MNVKACLVALLAGCFIGAAVVGWWYAPGKRAETPAAAARQPDGSLVLERRPDTKAKPAHAIPKGGKAERVVRVDVQPERADCPVCTVDLTLVRLPDDSRRVVASSPTGTILGGLDVPLVPLLIEKKRRLAVGVSHGTGADTWGVWIDRDFGPMRAGVEANKIYVEKYEARFKLGVAF